MDIIKAGNKVIVKDLHSNKQFLCMIEMHCGGAFCLKYNDHTIGIVLYPYPYPYSPLEPFIQQDSKDTSIWYLFPQSDGSYRFRVSNIGIDIDCRFEKNGIYPKMIIESFPHGFR